MYGNFALDIFCIINWNTNSCLKIVISILVTRSKLDLFILNALHIKRSLDLPRIKIENG